MAPCPKPAMGTFRRELREKRRAARADDPSVLPYQGPTAQRRAKKARAIVTAEQIVKDEVKRLDGYHCRWPKCYRHDSWPGEPLEAAHWKAEGMGGDPTLERCTLENLITLCAYHHRDNAAGVQWDHARMRPLDPVLGMRGPVEFSAAVPGEAGKFYVCGVSSPPEGVMNGEA